MDIKNTGGRLATFVRDNAPLIIGVLAVGGYLYMKTKCDAAFNSGYAAGLEKYIQTNFDV